MASKYALSAAVIVEAILTAILLAGCGGGTSSSGPKSFTLASVPNIVRLFDANGGPWLPNGGRWYSYQQSDQVCTTGIGFPDGPLSPASCFVWLTDVLGANNQWISSQGPWWVDPNHQQLEGGNGFGLIHVVAFSQIPAALHEPVDMDGSTVQFTTRVSDDWVRPVAPSRAGDRPAHAYLWFQTGPRKVANCKIDSTIGENCTRQSDYIYTDNWQPSAELDQSSSLAGHAFKIALRSVDTDKWTCLGAGRNVKYDCLPFDQAIKQVALMGVVIGPVRPCPIQGVPGPRVTCDRALLSSNLTSYFNPGRFDLKDLKVTVDAAFSSPLKPANMRMCTSDKPAVNWNPICFASLPVNQQSGGGAVHYLIPKNGGALKVGLTLMNAPATFEASGPHLYISPPNNEPGQPEPSLYAGVADTNGSISRTLSLSRYQEGDLVSIYRWKEWLVFTKNGEAIHMTPSPCGATSSECPLTPFMSTHVDNDTKPTIYFQ